jgi:hypothetical protein
MHLACSNASDNAKHDEHQTKHFSTMDPDNAKHNENQTKHFCKTQFYRALGQRKPQRLA